jgi:hypothetical protein
MMYLNAESFISVRRMQIETMGCLIGPVEKGPRIPRFERFVTESGKPFGRCSEFEL